MSTSEVAEPYAVDRRGWPSGPWDGEPDKVQWKSRVGLPALIVRNDSGALCGYVGVPRGHPARDADKDILDEEVSVHGGLTYADRCRGHICHVPGPGEPDDVLWLGFDCAHARDYWPGRWVGVRGAPAPLPAYRTIAYVRGECESLAEQLASMAEAASGAAPPSRPWQRFANRRRLARGRGPEEGRSA
jgi:hypothetical protein